ncbi:MAG: hypothetical protein ACXWTP_00205 [Methylosarcina sp.]
MHYLKALVFLLLSTPTWAISNNPILKNLSPGNIIFIGESHKHQESPKLVTDLVTHAVKKGQCLTLALEINSNQQPVIDRVLTKQAVISDIAILSAIDHLPMRQMIKHMAYLKKRLPCLSVMAIDAGIDEPTDRDEWMAKKLSEIARDRPVLVLVGALHTLKKVDWLVSTGRPSVAEILAMKGFRVKSFPQRWLPEQCGAGESRYSRFIGANKPEALAILNDSLMSLINARPHESAQGVVDGFVLWECGNQIRSGGKTLALSENANPENISATLLCC